MDPNSVAAFYARAYAYSQTKQYDDAIADYDRALSLDAENIEALYGRATAYFMVEEYQAAIADYEAVIELDPGHADAQNDLAWLYADNQINLNKAMELALEAVRLADDQGLDNETRANYLDTLGWVYFRLDELELAQVYIGQAADLSPSNPTFQQHLQAILARGN